MSEFIDKYWKDIRWKPAYIQFECNCCNERFFKVISNSYLNINFASKFKTKFLANCPNFVYLYKYIKATKPISNVKEFYPMSIVKAWLLSIFQKNHDHFSP